MTPKGLGWTRVLGTLGIVVALDQITKAAAVSAYGVGEKENVFFALAFTHVRNKGVAFGAFSGGSIVVPLLIGAALVGLVVYFARNAARPLLWLPTGLLLGGAVGNLADRARTGAVIDFIDPDLWPAFNLADAFIVVGVLMLAYVVERK